MGPDTTVGTAAIGGALGVIIVWILTLTGIEVPDTVGAAISTLCAVIFGWIVPHPALKADK